MCYRLVALIGAVLLIAGVSPVQAQQSPLSSRATAASAVAFNTAINRVSVEHPLEVPVHEQFSAVIEDDYVVNHWSAALVNSEATGAAPTCSDHPNLDVTVPGTTIRPGVPLDLEAAAQAQVGPAAVVTSLGRHLNDWRAYLDGELHDLDLEAAVESQFGPSWSLVAVGSHRCDWRAMDLSNVPPSVMPLVAVASDQFGDVDATAVGVARFHSVLGLVQEWYEARAGETFTMLEPLILPTDLTSEQWMKLSDWTDLDRWYTNPPTPAYIADEELCFTNPTIETCAAPDDSVEGGSDARSRFLLLGAAKYWAKAFDRETDTSFKIAFAPFVGDAADRWLGAAADQNGRYAVAAADATSVVCPPLRELDVLPLDETSACRRSAYAIGHELGHTFGLKHACEWQHPRDGPPPPSCEDSIMQSHWPPEAILVTAEQVHLRDSEFFGELQPPEPASPGTEPDVEIMVPVLDFNDAPNLVSLVNATNYSNTLDAPILRLYRAYFNREPDLAGAKYWLNIRRQNYGLLQIAGFMSDGQEFANNYSGVDDSEYLRRVYNNMLGRLYDQAGFNYWLDLLRGTNQHGLNPNLDRLSRSGVVFYVTGGTEFINNYPYTK